MADGTTTFTDGVKMTFAEDIKRWKAQYAKYRSAYRAGIVVGAVAMFVAIKVTAKPKTETIVYYVEGHPHAGYR